MLTRCKKPKFDIMKTLWCPKSANETPLGGPDTAKVRCYWLDRADLSMNGLRRY